MSEANENLWEVVYEALGFHREDDPDTGYQLRSAVKALCASYQDIYSLLREREDQPAPFALMLDPDKAPAGWLEFLAQWVGVIPTPDMTETQLRAEIKQPTGWRRGQTASIKLAAQRELTGTKKAIIRPNEPERGWLFVRTLASETPSPERVKATVRAATPAWLRLDYEAMAIVTLDDLESTWPKSLATLEGKFTTLADIEDTLPSELPE